MKGKPLIDFNEQEALNWTKSVKWFNLRILNSYYESSETGFVEFIAIYEEQGNLRSIHEISTFQYINDQWFYTEGHQPPQNHISKKIGQNSLCPCGSKKKYKKCHGKR